MFLFVIISSQALADENLTGFDRIYFTWQLYNFYKTNNQNDNFVSNKQIQYFNFLLNKSEILRQNEIPQFEPLLDLSNNEINGFVGFILFPIILIDITNFFIYRHTYYELLHYEALRNNNDVRLWQQNWEQQWLRERERDRERQRRIIDVPPE